MYVNPSELYSFSSNFYRTPNKELGKEEFLRLLITQLRYQNPVEPVENTEFIAQLAQFNSLEQMINLNRSFSQLLQIQSLTQGSYLIGRNVKAVEPDTGEEIVGKVQAVKLNEGNLYLLVEGREVNIENLQTVF